MMVKLQVRYFKMIGLTVLLIWCIFPNYLCAGEGGAKQGVKKLKDFVIYGNNQFYSAFPSAVISENGDIMVAFRRAPDRKIFNEPGTNHVDPNSYLVYVTSSDKGNTWTSEPELLYAHPFGGSQDPCLLKLNNGTILCTSYGWAFVRDERLKTLSPQLTTHHGNAVFLGGYLLFSFNDGTTWEGPVYPPAVPGEVRENAMGAPLPSYNRGALCQGKDGRVFWAVAASIDSSNIRRTSVHLLISEDKGKSWHYSCPVAADDSAAFNETSLYETPKGDLVAFIRTAGLEDQACIARSKDGGKSFGPWQEMGFRGHPLQAIRLPDNRVFLVYGYRHAPYGIRARILNAECTDFETAEEIIIRDDGDSRDIGYPWAVLLDDSQILVAYYFNDDEGTRIIAGSMLEIK